jgi:hypothetical protein
MIRRTILILLSCALLLPAGADAGPRSYTLEAHVGGAVNLPAQLRIEQEGHPEIRLDARYRSESFTPPIYWSIRLGTVSRKKGWEIELIHNKLFLKNKPPEVQSFSISHGFNMLFVNRALQRRGLTSRAGLGVVIAHPESEVRGLERPEEGGNLGNGYTLTGPALQVATGRALQLRSGFRAQVELKISGAYAKVPIARGTARVPNVAFHLLIGLGFATGR